MKNKQHICFGSYKCDAYRKQNSEKVKVLNRWKKKNGVLIMGYEAYERLVRSDTKEIIEALIDPGSFKCQ